MVDKTSYKNLVKKDKLECKADKDKGHALGQLQSDLPLDYHSPSSLKGSIF